MRPSALAAFVAAALALTTVPANADPVKPPQLSAAEITSVLNHDVSIAGTAWMTRPDGTVLVSYDSSVAGGKLTALTGVTKNLGDRVVLEKLSGKLTKRISGGSAIYGGGYKCSAGFNVQRRGKYYFLTAGHCGNVVSTWYSDEDQSIRIGTLHHSSYPWNDYALVVYRTDIRPPGGSDSGGPLFYRTYAFGLTSGGSGDCESGGITFFQPVVEALNAYGVSVY